MPELKADGKIPTLKQIVGHSWGEDISSHAEIERYLHALAKADPKRTKLVNHGQSTQGKNLYYLVISSAENLHNLEQIRRNNLALGDPRKTPPEAAKKISSSNPVIVWLAYCVHGNETSPSDAAMLTAYHLLADQRAATKEILDKAVIIIDPLQNPDGRDRFVYFHRQTRGAFDQASPLASDRLEPWPGGRTNHYYFDMNRDWYLHSQKETKARVAAFLQWKPQIFVDAHEMGANSTFFFDPPKEPLNPHVLPHQRDWYMKLGRHHAKRFDDFGFAYTTREIFDGFGPQYGSTWPTLHGSIGILWEQAGVRGKVVDRNDQTKLYYHDGVRHHYVSGIATIESAVQRRQGLLEDFYKTAVESVKVGKEGPVCSFFLLEENRPARAAALAEMIHRNGIEVRRVIKETAISARAILQGKDQMVTIPVGTYQIDLAQPASRLALTLLEKEQSMGKDFLDRQEERVKRRKPDEIYDVTAWSLPLAHGVPCYAATKPVSVVSELISQFSVSGKIIGGKAKVAYLLQGDDDNLMTGLCQLLRDGVRIHVLSEATKLNGTKMPRGSLLIRVAENKPKIHETMARAANNHGLAVHALDSAFVDNGAGLGGPHVHWIKPPRILLVVDQPTSYTVGHTWYLFDQAWKYPITRIAGRYLPQVDLNKFDVVILPHGKYAGDDAPGEDAIRRLKDWVRGGGTVVLSGGATEWATGEKVKLLSAKVVKKKIQNEEGDNEKEKDKKKPDTEPLQNVPGAFLRGMVDEDHFVTYGVDKKLDILFTGNLVLEPIKPQAGKNLISLADKNNLLVSGFCWQDTLKRIPGKTYLAYQSMGRGHIVAFADDPNHRALSPPLQRLFFNAVFFGPSH